MTSFIPMVLLAARGALVLASAVVAVALLRRASASTRHFVLLASFVALIAMPVLSSALPAWHVVVSTAVSDRASIDEPVAHRSALPVSETRSPESRSIATQDGATSNVAGSDPAPWSLPSFAQVAATLWAVGALFFMARLALGLVRARRLADDATPIDESRAHVIGAAGAAMGTRAFAVRFSDAVDVPTVTGVFSPTVLMPRASRAWDDERWRVVLMHELAHVRRRDCLAHVVAATARAIHWFNPLAWLAMRWMRAEREIAADDAVIAAGTRASSYATHLVAIAAAASDRVVPVGALAMAQRSELERRVRALVGKARVRRPNGPFATVAIVASAAAISLIVACASPSAPPAPATASVTPSVATIAPSAAAPRVSPLLEAAALAVGAPASRVELTIDTNVQAIVDDEMARIATEWTPHAANVIVLDPTTGAILAMAGRAPGDDPTLSVTRAYMPASTFKSILFAAALDEGAVSPEKKFFCDNGQRAYGKRVLHDWKGSGWLDVTQILAVSSNIGASRVYDALGGDRLGRWITRFHFGERPSVQVPNAAAGAAPSPMPSDPYDGATIAMGEALTASPLQVAAAYAALANDGVYNAPTMVRRVLGADGRPTWEHRPTRERLVKSTTAHAMMTMLEQVVASDEGTGRAARVDGVRVAGKTGTGDLAGEGADDERYYSTFVGVVPIDSPRFVILVGVETGKDAGYGGGKVAAPSFARIATRALAH